MNDWIPVTSALPAPQDLLMERPRKYAVLIKNQDVWFSASFYGNGTRAEGVWSSGEFKNAEVTHWFRLPPTPERENA